MKNQVAQIDLRQNAWECVLIRFIGEIEMELTFTARMRMIRFRLIRFREEIEIELTFTARSPLSSPTVLLNAQQRGWPPHYHLFIRI